MSSKILKNKSLFLFDFDGTLADTSGDIESSVNHLLTYYGLPPITFAQFKQHVGTGVTQLIDGILKEFYAAEKIDLTTALEIYNKHHVNNLTNTVKLYPQALELLKFLKESQCLCGIISNKYSFYTRKILDHLKISEFFTLVYGPDNVPERKPAPDGILLALKETKKEASQAVIIGDSLPDIIAGQNAGITTVAVTYGFNDEKKLTSQHPDCLFNDLGEIIKALN